MISQARVTDNIMSKLYLIYNSSISDISGPGYGQYHVKALRNLWFLYQWYLRPGLRTISCQRDWNYCQWSWQSLHHINVRSKHTQHKHNSPQTILNTTLKIVQHSHWGWKDKSDRQFKAKQNTLSFLPRCCWWTCDCIKQKLMVATRTYLLSGWQEVTEWIQQKC